MSAEYNIPDAVVALDADVVVLQVVVAHGDPPGQDLAEVLLSITVAATEVSLLGRGGPPDGSELVGFVFDRLQCFIVESRCWS